MQNNCYGLDWSTWNYYLFCADTTTESASDENCARVTQWWGLLPPFPRLCGEAPTERGTFFLLQVYKRIGLLLVLFFADRFFSGCSGFPLSPKANFSKFQFDPQRTDSLKRENKLQITMLVIYFLRLIPWSRKNWRCGLTWMDSKSLRYCRKYFLLKSK